MDKEFLNATIMMLMLQFKDNKLASTEPPGFTNPIIVETFHYLKGPYDFKVASILFNYNYLFSFSMWQEREHNIP